MKRNLAKLNRVCESTLRIFTQIIIMTFAVAGMAMLLIEEEYKIFQSETEED